MLGVSSLQSMCYKVCMYFGYFILIDKMNLYKFYITTEQKF